MMQRLNRCIGSRYGSRLWVPALVSLAGCAAPRAEWLQWGGPNRNFIVDAKGLAETWPAEGPKKLWHRELGDGYSTIVADHGVLYTMYRTGENEFTVALDANTGKTIWEHRNPSPFTPVMTEFGPGPHSTPLVEGGRLYTIGANAVMHCFDKKTGDVLWKHDLAAEYGAPVPERGYGASPLAYKNTVIVPVDRKRQPPPGGDGAQAAVPETQPTADGQSLMAFDQKTGEVVWKSQDFEISYPSPILIDFHGEVQLVLLLAEGIMGVNPDDGRLLWHLAFPPPPGANIATPLWTGDDLLFCSSAYDSGSRVIRLTQKEGKTVPEQLWYSRKMRIHHGNAVRIGDHVYGSSGDFGSTFFACMDVKTGDALWRERGLKKATCLHADGKLILLDEDGTLALATATPESLTIRSTCKIAEPHAWAAPTLVGTTLYVRDRKHIMALDLG